MVPPSVTTLALHCCIFTKFDNIKSCSIIILYINKCHDSNIPTKICLHMFKWTRTLLWNDTLNHIEVNTMAGCWQHPQWFEQNILNFFPLRHISKESAETSLVVSDGERWKPGEFHCFKNFKSEIFVWSHTSQLLLTFKELVHEK